MDSSDPFDTDVVAPARPARPRLLPRLGILSVIGTVAAMFPSNVDMLSGPLGAVIMTAVLTYLAWTILRTRDMLHALESLHWLDVWLCRKSGPLCMGAATALVCFAIVEISDAIRHDTEPVWLTSRLAVSAIYAIMEPAFVLGMACLMSSKEVGHVRPLLLWKTLCVPLIIIFGLYIVLVPMASLAT